MLTDPALFTVCEFGRELLDASREAIAQAMLRYVSRPPEKSASDRKIMTEKGDVMMNRCPLSASPFSAFERCACGSFR